ncbi:MAG: leucyl/phenylalanyl-tRNA--protein transferase [Planctomycetes bacterium]|nr:leucyl/phenylalanyl-tRNA--protein transferase [Planctomycetota bacterium]
MTTPFSIRSPRHGCIPTYPRYNRANTLALEPGTIVTSLSELTPGRLLTAYAQGFFPMAEGRDEPTIHWFHPDPRAILPLDAFDPSRSVRSLIRRGVFDLRSDTAFAEVIQECARPRPSQDETWINPEIIDAYIELHRIGHAHSIEAWVGDRLVGGLYGVHIGAAFFGESMFHRPDLGGTNASKVCLAHLVSHLNDRGFQLLDVQLQSPHMERLGSIEIPRDEFIQRLAHAVRRRATW